MLKIPRTEGISLGWLPRVEPFAKPSYPLGPGSVSEGLGHDIPLRLLLDVVVANGAGGVEGFFDVAGLKDVAHGLGVMGPDASEEVGLKFQAHGKIIRL